MTEAVILNIVLFLPVAGIGLLVMVPRRNESAMRGLTLALMIAQTAQAQTPATPQSAPAQPAPAPPPAVVAGIPVNYDESKVGTYTLPDPLVTSKGVRVRDALTWRRIRRPEILLVDHARGGGARPGGAR